MSLVVFGLYGYLVSSLDWWLTDVCLAYPFCFLKFVSCYCEGAELQDHHEAVEQLARSERRLVTD